MSPSQATVRYIGSKQRVLAQIAALIGEPTTSGRFIDGFCGTGIVAARAADLGWRVAVNDHLEAATTIAAGHLASITDARFDSLGGYEAAIGLLNSTPCESGFIWREYSPAARSNSKAQVERRYFSEHNAQRVDGIRSKISALLASGAISFAETRLLLADLLAAASRVANTAGTYGCFLRDWQQSALSPLTMVPRTLRSLNVDAEYTNVDVFDLSVDKDDTVYFDPPYTKRQYAAYYHVLETITRGDSPDVNGVTGLRPWKHLASPFCYKAKAETAIVNLIRNTSANRVLLSYSDEGHVDLEALCRRLREIGSVTIHGLDVIGRYRPNESAAEKSSSVHEFIIEVLKPSSRGSSA